MKIAVLGTGYVGLITGTCFAESGNHVTCLDIDEEKIEQLQQGKIPIYEPGLSELVVRNLDAGRLNFSTDLVEPISTAKLIFLAVGTPPADDGAADLTALWAAVDQISPYLAQDAVIVIKSTVPVGTNAQLAERLLETLGRACDVVSNPEFLKEGAAIDDFTKPDRVVIGVRREEVVNLLKDLYSPFLRTERPLLVMSPESAEMTKYVANALLSTKISFINEIANLCEYLQADINDVRRGIGHDQRIGFSFLFPGVGYGGSCFPKDVRALGKLAEENGIDPLILEAVDTVNSRQKLIMIKKITKYFGDSIKGKTFAIWGLAFKPRTDDIREAPALVLIDQLLELGATIQVHDPEAMGNVKSMYGDKLTYAQEKSAALDKADALVIMTEWSEFRNPDFQEMKQKMNQPVIFDGRNLYSLQQMRDAKFYYNSIGRECIDLTVKKNDNHTVDQV